MDWRILWATFITIFVAEIGDKTQFAAFAATANTKSTGSVWLGVILGLTLAGTLGVLAGKALSEFLNPQTVKYISGSLFIIMGVWTLLSK